MRLGLFSNTDRLNGTNQRSLLQRFHGTLRWYLAHLIKGRSQKSTAGFTLAELLITLIISSIIIVGLLTLVVDLVSSNLSEK